ncbi:hypothetical protein BX666DRAFT_2032575 [Dichotomocladium elegans]|nr:hypothetical protein BX666DRAFT_2032575 [Dichotomocladium elegans]
MFFRDECIPASNIRLIQWFKLDEFQPERAVTSSFVSTRTLLLLRIPLVMYTAIVFWFDFGNSIATGEFHHFFAYFTRFTFVGLHAYMITTLYHHIRYILIRQPRCPASFLDQPAILNYLYVLLYHTVITFNILTPAVYWSLLSGTLINKADVTSLDWWLGVSVHAITFFIMMFEVMMSRMLLKLRLVILVFLIVVCYMMLTFIIYGTEGWWVYSFLDWTQGPSAAIWYIAVATMVVLCFFLQVGLHALRDCCGRRRRLNGEDDDERTEQGDAIPSKTVDLANEDKRYYSQTLVESNIESHITLGPFSTDHLSS